MHSKRIAEFVASLNYEDLPKEVIEKAKDCVRDHLACILGSYPEANSSFITCQFSLPYILAVAVSDRTLGPKQYRREKISDPKIQEIAKKVRKRLTGSSAVWRS